MSNGNTPATPTSGSGEAPGARTGPGPSPLSTPLYEERLLPTPGVWAALVLVAVMLALVALRYGVIGSLITFVLALAVEAGLMISSTPRLAVGPELFVAGGARIPPSLLGPAQALDADAMTRATRTELDARAFLCIRGWLKQGVRVQLDDPEDPTPYWLVSSRRPAELVAALESARRQA
jgi:hypothetical protein